MTNNQLKKILKNNFICDEVGMSKGKVIVRKGYFYTAGKKAEDQEDLVRRFMVETLGMDGCMFNLESGCHWAPFKGSASLRTSSHWWVTIELLNIKPINVKLVKKEGFKSSTGLTYTGHAEIVK